MIPRATAASLRLVGPLLLCLAPFMAGCQHARGSASDGEVLSGRAGVGPKAVFLEEQFDFGELASGNLVEHDFLVRNEGDAALSIKKVSMTTPLLVTQIPREVAPGSEGKIHLKLDTTELAGKFEGVIAVFLNDRKLQQATLAFRGRIIPSIELTPMSAFFVAGQRGRGGHADIEILNHERDPLRINKIEHRTDRFRTKLETLEDGQRYRLTLSLRPDGLAGKGAETILIDTSSKKIPHLKIAANTYLYERVHTFPDAVSLGTLGSNEIGEASFTLMIYQEGGKDFRLKLSTDIPGLSLTWERGPKGDRYQASVSLLHGKLPVGPIKGSIFADTNDPQFPRLAVPVDGQIVDR